MNIFYFVSLALILIACTSSFDYENSDSKEMALLAEVGDPIDSLDGVLVYYNGRDYTQSQGKHYSSDGYYYGQKGQCVEFVKRYYCDALDHKMPNVWGNAIDFFDKNLLNNSLNKSRNLTQFIHGSSETPQKGDLIVFPITKYGHVAIISAVHDDHIEIVQQNCGMKTRKTLMYTLNSDGHAIFTSGKTPLGWLRKH